MKINPIKDLPPRTINIPGDKSISHRALIFASLADGSCTLSNINSGQDIRSTICCLETLGIETEQKEESLKVSGKSPTQWCQPGNQLDAGNSGTTLRLLSGVLSALPFSSIITGDSSLRRRPMQRIIEPLTLMGAKIDSDNGYPPLHFYPSQLHGINYSSPVSSAQVKSCLLLAALASGNSIKLSEPFKSRDHTERFMLSLNLPIFISGNSVCLDVCRDALPSFSYHLPGDPSSAAFLAAVYALQDSSRLTLPNILINPTRFEFFKLLTEMGADVQIKNQRTVHNEPIGDVIISGKVHRSVNITPERVPALIDELPLIAVLATQCDGVSHIRGAAELRIKESDRITAIGNNLKSMGAEIQEYSDGLSISGPTKLQGALLDSFGDHRIAMSCAVAASIAGGQSLLKNANCVQISFPEFFDILKRFTG